MMKYSQVYKDSMMQYECGGLFIFDPGSYKLTRMDKYKEIRLSHKEASVLALLCMNAQQVVRRDLIVKEIWHNGVGCDNNLNKSILRLRRKFESIGLVDVINTTPRVGYMLNLPVKQESVNVTSSFFNENIEVVDDDASVPTWRVYRGAEKAGFFLMKKMMKPIFVTLAVFFTAFIIQNLNSNYNNSAITKIMPIKPLGKVNYNNNGRHVFYTRDINSPTQYSSLELLIDHNKSFYSLISKRAISYVELDMKGDFALQKVFLIDRSSNIELQLKCIAKNINDKGGDVSRGSGGSNRPSIFYTSFYRPCLNDNAFLGDLKIVSTRSSGDEHEGVTWTQDVAFITLDNNAVFNFKRISRAKEYKANVSHLDVKSFTVKQVKQNVLQQDPDISYIFNQLTQDDTYQIKIAPDKKIYVSSLFGGVIYSKQ